MDRFQGQQNDYILLSLVRTKAVGHLRYVRTSFCSAIEVLVLSVRHRNVYSTLHKSVVLYEYVVEMEFSAMYITKFRHTSFYNSGPLFSTTLSFCNGSYPRNSFYYCR